MNFDPSTFSFGSVNISVKATFNSSKLVAFLQNGTSSEYIMSKSVDVIFIFELFVSINMLDKIGSVVFFSIIP